MFRGESAGIANIYALEFYGICNQYAAARAIIKYNIGYDIWIDFIY